MSPPNSDAEPSAEPTAPRPGGALVLATLLVGYASFYLCRANVDAAVPALQGAYGYEKQQIGVFLSIAVASYAVGKVVLGTIGDIVGGKTIMLLSMGGSIACSFAIGAVEWPRAAGLGGGLLVMGALFSANRFSQSGGWGGVVHVVAQWFPPEKNGTVMGILSMSYEVGAIVALLLCSVLIDTRFGWRALFLVNASLFTVVALFVAFTLKGRPPVPAGVKRERPPRAPLGEVLPHLARQPAFWTAVGLSALLTFVRTCFMTWTPSYLAEVATAEGSTSPISAGIAKSAFFGVAGMTAALTVGRISDRFGPGKRAPVMVVSLALLVVTILFLAHGNIHGSLASALVIALCGLFLLGPYSLLAGAVALDVAGKRGTATAAGIIDAVGYLGASLAGVVIGSVAQRSGWTAAFDVIAATAMVALLIALAWAFMGRRASTDAVAGAP